MLNTAKPAAHPRSLPIHSRRLSHLEQLEVRRLALWEEHHRLDCAELALTGTDTAEQLIKLNIQHRMSEIEDESDVIIDLMTFGQPQTLREISILLGALSLHVGPLASCSDEDEKGRNEHRSKIDRIIEAIQFALKDVPELTPVEHQIPTNPKTEALLLEAAVLTNGDAPNLTLVAA